MGEAARRRLYETAIRLIASRGYEVTTLRDISKRAGVSPGLLYRYFPGKRAVVLALYDDLSAAYADRASKMTPGTWADRFLFALETSLEVLAGQRRALGALSSILLGDREAGLFAPSTAASRHRVEAVFIEAVRGATDAAGADAAQLGRLLYFAHLAFILWWLLDKSPRQRATRELIALLARLLPAVAPLLGLVPPGSIETLARLCEDGLVGGGATAPSDPRRAGRGSRVR